MVDVWETVRQSCHHILKSNIIRIIIRIISFQTTLASWLTHEWDQHILPVYENVQEWKKRNLRIFPNQMTFNQTVFTTLSKANYLMGSALGLNPLYPHLKILLLSLWEFHTMYLDHIHPCPNSFYTHPLFPNLPIHPTLSVLILYFSASNLVCVAQLDLGVALEYAGPTRSFPPVIK